VRDSIAKRFPNDNDAQFKAVAAWRETHPTPIATIADVADHLDHIKKIAGASHVGIGGDFDGITETVQGLEDVSTYPTLFAELRDIVLTTLGTKQVEQLTDMATREQFKTEIIKAIDERIGKNSVKRIYFPQFVVQ
jgi:hypothetical protein